jgi:hypothetical protein
VLIGADHRRWIIATVVAVLIAVGGYGVYVRNGLRGPSGGSWPGLFYGAAGLALMIYAGLLGARRKASTRRIGRASTWLKGHLWLGLLSYVLILFHSGFRWGGPLTFTLMILFTLVVLSGIYGVALQHTVPRMMLIQLPLETVYEQIDSIVTQLRSEADALVTAVAGPLPINDVMRETERSGEGGLSPEQVLRRPTRVAAPTSATPLPEGALLKDAYVKEVRPFLAVHLPRRFHVSVPRLDEAVFVQLGTVLPAAFGEIVDQLRFICEERRQLAVQLRLHHWLHGWLLVHVPLSMALVLLSIAHAVVAVRY